MAFIWYFLFFQEVNESMNRITKYIVMILLIIVADQYSKDYVSKNIKYGESIVVIDGFFNFSHVHNYGAAFGMGSSWSNPKIIKTVEEKKRGQLYKLLILRILPVLACFWLMFLVWSNREKDYFLSLAYSLIIAGATGNLIDRFRLNYVIDFLDFHLYERHFDSFNIADSSISIAAGLLIYDFISNFIKERKKNLLP
jgi:signal peptidase II